MPLMPKGGVNGSWAGLPGMPPRWCTCPLLAGKVQLPSQGCPETTPSCYLALLSVPNTFSSGGNRGREEEVNESSKKTKSRKGEREPHELDCERNGTWGGRRSQQRPRWLPGTGASQELTPCQPTVSSQAGNLRWTG